jgi:hypothetical protein
MAQGLVNRAGEERVEGAGGLNLFIRSWRLGGAARGIVVIVPGFNSERTSRAGSMRDCPLREDASGSARRESSVAVASPRETHRDNGCAPGGAFVACNTCHGGRR